MLLRVPEYLKLWSKQIRIREWKKSIVFWAMATGRMAIRRIIDDITNALQLTDTKVWRNNG